jgi:hypothetical protein
MSMPMSMENVVLFENDVVQVKQILGETVIKIKREGQDIFRIIPRGKTIEISDLRNRQIMIDQNAGDIVTLKDVS